MKTRSVLATLAMIALPVLALAIGTAGQASPTNPPAPAAEAAVAPPAPAPETSEVGVSEVDPFYGTHQLETAAPICMPCRILAGRSCPGKPAGYACNDSGCICRKCKGAFDCFQP